MSNSKFVLISTMKNEGPYILEWVAYNRVIGFSNIVVYTNDCFDGTNEILLRLEELGEVNFHNNKIGRGGIHRSALRQARKLDVFRQADWVCVADIDEFLNIHVGDGTLPNLIDTLDPQTDVLSVAWKIFGSSGLREMIDEPVTMQFCDAEIDPEKGGAKRRFVKSLFRRQGEFYRVGLHGPIPREGEDAKFLWSQPGGRPTAQRIGNHVGADYGYETAQVNHYAVRSAQSYLLKKDRGRANHMNHSLSTEYWERWNRGGQEDRTILRHNSETRRLMKKYRSDPVLDGLHKKAFDWHAERIRELMRLEEYKMLWKRIC